VEIGFSLRVAVLMAKYRRENSARLTRRAGRVLNFMILDRKFIDNQFKEKYLIYQYFN
jgi:hypothetical protein